MTTTDYTTCRQCGVTFGQPHDPGRRREFCSGACRQKAYRARGGRASGTRGESKASRERREREEAWAREEARKERERERSRARRGRGQEQIHVPDWCRPNWRDDPATAKRRATCEAMMKRANHAATPAGEAKQCRDTAEKWRTRYGL